MAGIPFRRNERLMGIAVLVVPAALCPLLRYAFPLTTPRFEAERGIYRYQKDAWSAAPALRGGTWGVWVSDQGAVWTCPIRYGGLSRLDGNHWISFGSDEYGADTEWFRG